MEKRKCVECGREFEPVNGSQVVCSTECRKKRQAKSNLESYHRKNEKSKFKPKLCRVCKKKFVPTSANQRYCSDECKRKGTMADLVKKAPKENSVDIQIGMIGTICPVCGKVFYRMDEWAYRRGKALFCSWHCLSKFDRDSGINLDEYYRKSDGIGHTVAERTK